MEEGIILGFMLGAIAGVIVMTSCKPVRDMVEQGKEKVKQQVAKM